MTSFKKTGWIATGLCVSALLSGVASADEGLGPMQAAPLAAVSPTMDEEPSELPSRGGPIAAIITGAATTAAFGAITLSCASMSGPVDFVGLALLVPCGASAILTPISAAHLVGGIAWLVAVNKWRDNVAREGSAHWTERVNVSVAPTAAPSTRRELDGASVQISVRF
jgi:hypothetical protein